MPAAPAPSRERLLFFEQPEDRHRDLFLFHGDNFVHVFFKQRIGQRAHLPHRDAVGNGRRGRHQYWMMLQ